MSGIFRILVTQLGKIRENVKYWQMTCVVTRRSLRKKSWKNTNVQGRNFENPNLVTNLGLVHPRPQVCSVLTTVEIITMCWFGLFPGATSAQALKKGLKMKQHLSNGHADATVNGASEENNNAGAKEVNGVHKSKKNKKNGGDEAKETEGDEETSKKDEQEVVFIQDMGFTVKIVSPGIEPFDIQVLQQP